MALPKLEGLITVPTGGWSAAIVDNDGSFTATIAAGDYFLTSVAPSGTVTFLGALKTALDNGAGVTYTCSVSDTDASGTGKTTITASAGNASITWTSSGLRDALGFTGTVSGASTYTSTNASPYIWLPNTVRAPGLAPDGARGLPVSDAATTVSPTGTSKGIYYATRYVDRLEWRYVLGSKAWAYLAVVTNEALETFYLNTIGKARPMRYHPDRATDATYLSYRAANPQAFNAVPNDRHVSSAASLWHIGFDVVEYTT